MQARNVEALPTYQLVQNGRLLLQFTGSDDVKLKMETIRFGAASASARRSTGSRGERRALGEILARPELLDRAVHTTDNC